MLSQYSITALIQGYTNLFVDELYVTDKQLYKKKSTPVSDQNILIGLKFDSNKYF